MAASSSRVLRCDAAPDLFLGEEREPALDEIEPRRAGRREVQMEARALGQPAPDHRRLVRAVVVEDEVDVEVRGHVRLDRVEELAELDRCDGGDDTRR